MGKYVLLRVRLLKTVAIREHSVNERVPVVAERQSSGYIVLCTSDTLNASQHSVAPFHIIDAIIRVSSSMGPSDAVYCSVHRGTVEPRALWES